MAQVINTNVASLFAQQALNKSAKALGIAQQRLSSGVRINTGADDPTGLVTATGYDSQIRGANQAQRNASDGISTAQINDGYHGQILENLQRLREIAVQLGGTASGAETTALVAENTRILALTTATGAVVTAVIAVSSEAIVRPATNVALVPTPVTVPPFELTTTVPVFPAKARIRVFSATSAVVSAPTAVPPNCTAISRRRCRFSRTCP